MQQLTPTSVKIKHIKNMPKKGDILRPFDDNDHGAVGRLFEDLVEHNGFTINKGKGPDLHNVELKTMKQGTKSAVSICRANTNDIKTTNWDQSEFKSKCQRQWIVEYNEFTGVVTESDMYDMSDSETQQRLSDAYNEIQKKFKNLKQEKTISGGAIIAERRDENDDGWQLRIPKKTLIKIKDHIKSIDIKNAIFEF